MRNIVVRPGNLISDSDRSMRRLGKYAAEHNWQTASGKMLVLVVSSLQMSSYEDGS